MQDYTDYFDNASTTYVYPEVIDAIVNILNEYNGNPSNHYEEGLLAKNYIEEAREKIAKCINAEPGEIIFTSCASESNALAINQAGLCIASPYEHHDIKENKKTMIIDDVNFLKSKKKYYMYDAVVYAHMLVNNETGEIFNLKPLINHAHELNMMVLVDCTQALGNIPIDVKEIDADFMSFSFHKCHAPKGVGALYISKTVQKNIKIDPIIYGSQEQGIRGGTENVPYIVAAGIAVPKAIEEMNQKRMVCNSFKSRFLNILANSNVPYIVNEGKNNSSSILNIAFKDIMGEALTLLLDAKGFSVSTGSACNTGDLRPSEVLEAMNVPKEYIQGAIRISFSMMNTTEEVEALAKTIIETYYEMVGMK